MNRMKLTWISITAGSTTETKKNSTTNPNATQRSLPSCIGRAE